MFEFEFDLVHLSVSTQCAVELPGRFSYVLGPRLEYRQE